MSKAEVPSHLRLARETLEAARVVLAAGLPRRALSEAYFAMHQAARAALASRDIEARTHKGTLHRLREAFGDRIEAGMLRGLARLQGLRERSDYDADARISEDEAATALQDAEAFVEHVADMLRDGG